MDRTGSVVAGRFVLEGLAGTGGMSTVYRALDRASGTHVAVKLLDRNEAADAQRFEREARVLSSLRHPGFTRYVDHGIDEGRGYLAMEWLEGEDLETRLRREPLEWSESITLVMHASRALAVAHKKGVVHRDLKPSNLFLVDARVDRVKVLDLGVARLVQDSHRATRTGVVIGTPLYMSPEQARGAKNLDARADVFSLGCVLFECFTGAPPFDGEHLVSVLAKILVHEAPRLSERFAEVPEELDDLVARMLAKAPIDRPSDGGAVADALGRFGGVSSHSRPPRSILPPALTTTEQRLLSIVLMHPPPEDGHPLDVQGPMTLVRRMQALLEPYGAGAQWMVDGSTLVTLHGDSAATDQAQRIARCALALAAVLPGAPLAIATGRGVLGHLPVGEVIDRAAQMLARCDEPRILIDEVTAGLLGERFAIGGDEHGLSLLRELEEDLEGRTILGKPSPCVGRDRQLAALEAAFDECVQEPVARVMLVTGEPGIGKSRLRHELLTRLRRRASHAEVWIGRGDPLGTRSPFGLLTPALRRASGIRDGEPLALRRQKLRARVARHLPMARVARVAGFLGELLGVPFEEELTPELAAARRDPVLMGDQMRRAWEDLVTAESHAAPLVIVLDDLQWGDVPSIELCDAALRHCADAPLFVAAFARPEVHETFVSLWRARDVEELRIAGLSRKASAELVRYVLGDSLAQRDIDLLVDRAAGNAFYLEELIRAVAEGRGQDLPPTVLAMAQARLEHTDVEARRVLRAASVFGRVFWRGGVKSLLGGAARDIDISRWLSMLVDDELIQRLTDEDEFSFRHILLRDAAYAGLTERDRRVGHRLAGEWLEHAGENDAAVLAEHFDRAGERERACRAWHRGAEQALEAHDFEAAIARSERSLDSGAAALDTDGSAHEHAGAMRLVQAEAHRWLGRFGDARDAAGAALPMLPAGSAGWYRAVEELLIATPRLGAFEVAATWAEQLAQATPQRGTESAHVRALACAARALFQAGDYPRADALMDDIQRIVESGASIQRPALAEFHRLRGARARHSGDVAGDFAGYLAALESCELGDERQACNARVSLGFAYIELGDHAAARAELERALAAADRMGLSTIASRARQNLALVCAAEGELDEARRLAREVIQESEAQGNLRFEGWTRIYLSRIEHARGDYAAAEREAALAVQRTEVTPPARAGALAALSLAMLALDRDALTSARAALEILGSLGGIEEFEALVRRAHVEALLANAMHDEARTALSNARERLHALAKRIADPEHRKSFLERVPDNARLLELAAGLA